MGAHQHRRRGGGLALLAVAAVVVAGCSSEKKVAPVPAGSGQALSLVSSREVEARKNGSPEHTVLAWWRLAQFRDVQDSRALFTVPARRELDRAGYAVLLVRWLGPWIRNGKPTIQRIQPVGRNHVIVFVETNFNVPVGTDLVRHDKDVVSFSLDRGSRNSWAISDTSWVIQTADGLRQAAAQAQRNAAGRAAP